MILLDTIYILNYSNWNQIKYYKDIYIYKLMRSLFIKTKIKTHIKPYYY